MNQLRKICLIWIFLFSLCGTLCTKKRSTPLETAAKEFLYVLENKDEYNAKLAELTRKESESFNSEQGFTPSTPPAWGHQLFFKANEFVDTYEKFGDLTNQSYLDAKKEYDDYVSFNILRLPSGGDCMFGRLDVTQKSYCAKLSEEKEKLWWKAVSSYRAIAARVVAAQP